MAASQGLSKSAIATLWNSHSLKPHHAETIKPSHACIWIRLTKPSCSVSMKRAGFRLSIAHSPDSR
jgi:hypothetical protein